MIKRSRTVGLNRFLRTHTSYRPLPLDVGFLQSVPYW